MRVLYPCEQSRGTSWGDLAALDGKERSRIIYMRVPTFTVSHPRTPTLANETYCGIFLPNRPVRARPRASARMSQDEQEKRPG